MLSKIDVAPLRATVAARRPALQLLPSLSISQVAPDPLGFNGIQGMEAARFLCAQFLG